MHANVNFDAVTLFILHLVVWRGAVVGRHMISRRLGWKTRLAPLFTDHVLHGFQDVTDGHTWANVFTGPFAALGRNSARLAMAI